MRYVRRSPYIDAVLFTAELGELQEQGGKLVVCDAGRDIGITYAEGKGFSYLGSGLKFGDFMVLTPGVKPVWSAKDFHAQFKPKDKA
jgi:hypothetical protein